MRTGKEWKLGCSAYVGIDNGLEGDGVFVIVSGYFDDGVFAIVNPFVDGHFQRDVFGDSVRLGFRSENSPEIGIACRGVFTAN